MNRWLLPVAAAIAALAIVAVQQPALAQVPPLAPVPPEACDTAAVVPDPTNNPELVADCKILAGAKSTLEGTHGNVGRRLDWSASKELSTWEGIAVDGSPKRVTELALDHNDGSTALKGEVPAALGSLSGLVKLSLHWNQLSGEIPPELGSLAELTYLRLSVNQLRGEIPPEIGNLSKLGVLNLASNNLSGAIPDEIWGLTELYGLILHANGLTGTIPPEIKNLTKLKTLYLHLTSVSGSIPTEIGQLSQLEDIAIYETGLTGEIPVSFGNLSKLRRVHLYDNALTGSIPTQLGNLSALTDLLLSNNNLSGSIPASLERLTLLEDLRLSWNSLSGCIPPKLLEVARNDLSYLGLPTCGSGTNAAPSLTSAVVDGATLTLTYNETLDEDSRPDGNDFTVTVNDVDSAAANAEVRGDTVVLTLGSAVEAGDVVLVSYRPDVFPIQDEDGALAAWLTNHPVTNNTTGPPAIASATVDGAELVLTYGKALDTGSTPATSAYTVSVNGSTSEHAVDDVEVSDSRVTLTLVPAVVASDVVLVSYTPGSDPVQDAGGAGAAELTDHEVTNNTPPPNNVPVFTSTAFTVAENTQPVDPTP